MNLMQDAANPFHTGPAGRTAVCVHIAALPGKKGKKSYGNSNSPKFWIAVLFISMNKATRI